MSNSEEWRKANHIKTERVVIELDAVSYGWLLRESKRTSLPVADVATTLLRKTCADKLEIGIK